MIRSLHIMLVRASVVLSAAMLCPQIATGLAWSADWPQFMRQAAHTGDAPEESLRLPLALAAQIKLDDAVMAAPAVVGGLAYVVDQMGTAYCLDPVADKIVWKASPDGAGAMGFNTSSPCVSQGRMYFGTTAGNFHVLDLRDGSTIKSLKIGHPIISSPTLANDAVYFQAIDAVLRCVDLRGEPRWQWDHYARYVEPPAITKAQAPMRGHPGSYDRPHYGGGEVAVSGKKIVTSFGWDIVCLEDTGGEAKPLWCNRAPTGRDGASPMSSSISGDWVYTAGMGADGTLGLTRFSLATGEVSRVGGESRQANAWNTPAVRGGMVTYRNSHDGRNGVMLFDFEKKSSIGGWRDKTDATPMAASQVLTKDHLLATTLRGELIAIDLTKKPGEELQRWQTPHGRGIASTPAVADGHVYFGCDDGYFYVLASAEKSEGRPAATREPKRDESLTVIAPRSLPLASSGKASDWPSTYGNSGNTSFQDDAKLGPMLRVRWTTRGYGHQLSPCVASGGDIITVTLLGLVTCQEQATGRLRWRTQMPGPEWMTASGMLVSEGRVYLPRPTFGRMEGAFYCLDQRDGKLLWKADIGGRYVWERVAPVLAGGIVAFGFGTPADKAAGKPTGTMVQAWHAATGKTAWQVPLNVAGTRSGSIGGCTDGKTMYFTSGAQKWNWKQEGDKQRGETVAIEASSGKVLWRNAELFGESYPVLAGDRLLLNCEGLKSVNPTDGKLQWSRKPDYNTKFSIGDDYLVMRGYGGHGTKVKLSDGLDYPNCKELGGETHSCSTVTLTSLYSFAATVGGLNVREVATGKLLWQSPGFAPRGCVNPIIANGRLFWPSAASGTVFCWESQ